MTWPTADAGRSHPLRRQRHAVQYQLGGHGRQLLPERRHEHAQRHVASSACPAARSATTTSAGEHRAEQRRHDSNVESGSTLTLDANMNIGVNGFLNVQDSGSTFDMGGFSFTANELQLGWNGSARR